MPNHVVNSPEDGARRCSCQESTGVAAANREASEAPCKSTGANIVPELIGCCFCARNQVDFLK